MESVRRDFGKSLDELTEQLHRLRCAEMDLLAERDKSASLLAERDQLTELNRALQDELRGFRAKNSDVEGGEIITFQGEESNLGNPLTHSHTQIPPVQRPRRETAAVGDSVQGSREQQQQQPGGTCRE